MKISTMIISLWMKLLNMSIATYENSLEFSDFVFIFIMIPDFNYSWDYSRKEYQNKSITGIFPRIIL